MSGDACATIRGIRHVVRRRAVVKSLRFRSHLCHNAAPAFSTRSLSLSVTNSSGPAQQTQLPTYIPSKHSYTFHIGTSWAAKPNDPLVRSRAPFPPDTVIGAWRDRMIARRKMDPGEDFFFVQEMRSKSGISFGVADGVGGWVESGVDPSLFSQALMYHAHRYSRSAWAGEPEVDPSMDYEEREQVEGWEMTPYECLDLAYGGVLREKYVQAGSSTACIISLNASSGLLRSANLGDSGFSIIRSNSILYRSPSQTHFFNCPRQLTKLPASERRSFSRACVDSPSEANVSEIRLRDGDVVVVYTDGFSDNVFPSEMVTICSLVARAGGPEGRQVQSMADRMVEYARQCMKSRTRVSPFEREAARQGMYFRGGKIDDVTIIVGLIQETS